MYFKLSRLSRKTILKKIEIECPYLIFENVGFNLSLNVNVLISMISLPLLTFSYSEIGSIDTKEKIVYGISLSFLPDDLKNFERISIKPEDEYYYDFLEIKRFYKIEDNDMEFVVSSPICMALNYQDIYGINYKQEHNGRLYVAKVFDRYYICVKFQNYANSIIDNELK